MSFWDKAFGFVGKAVKSYYKGSPMDVTRKILRKHGAKYLGAATGAASRARDFTKASIGAAKMPRGYLPGMGGGMAGMTKQQIKDWLRRGATAVGIGAGFEAGSEMIEGMTGTGAAPARRRTRGRGAPSKRDIQGCARVQRFLDKFQSCGCKKRVPKLKRGRR